MGQLKKQYKVLVLTNKLPKEPEVITFNNPTSGQNIKFMVTC